MTAPPMPGAPELPDEATLNRLAGEFFAALPGALPGESKWPGGAGLPGGAGTLDPAGGVGEAPRVDVLATASSVDRVPGETGAADQPAGPAGGLPAVSPPGLTVTDPMAAVGVSPGRAIPDRTEATAGLLGGGGLGPLLPEGPI
ncbi:MAG TPA: hypothetical protein VII33_04585, partial [Nakamurella sp.]